MPILSPDQNNNLGYQLVFVITEPRPQDRQFTPNSKQSKASIHPKDDEEEKIPKSQASNFPNKKLHIPSSAQDEDDPVFIPNTLKQYSMSL